jgi:hypothetical protein
VAGRVWILCWAFLRAFLRAWLFGVVLGLVTGGVFGTLLVPVVGTVFGGAIGAGMGAITGLPFAILVAPVSLLPTSVAADRVWPAIVAAGLAFVLVSKVMLADASLDASEDLVIFACTALVSGLLAGLFGRAVTRGKRVRVLRAPVTLVLFASAGTLVSAARLVMLAGWSETELGVVLLCAYAGCIGGGILGLALIGYNLLVTKEPAPE